MDTKFVWCQRNSIAVSTNNIPIGWFDKQSKIHSFRLTWYALSLVKANKQTNRTNQIKTNKQTNKQRYTSTQIKEARISITKRRE
jgi:hypothetical protein